MLNISNILEVHLPEFKRYGKKSVIRETDAVEEPFRPRSILDLTINC